jgi:hypothetical protein
LAIGFIKNLHNVTTNKYNAIANSHTLQFTTTRSKTSQSAVSSPAVACSFLSFRVHVLTGRPLSHNSLPGWRPSHTNLLLFLLPSQESLVIAAAPRYIASARTAKINRFQQFFYCCVRPLRPLLSSGRCLQSCYLATAVV